MIERDDILEATIAVLARYGVRKTAMIDVAQAAGVSRQTLYGRFGDKEGIVVAAVEYLAEKALADLRQAWRQQAGLPRQLDSYFELTTIAMYRMIQTTPDARDIVSGRNAAFADASRRVEARKAGALADILAPYSAELAAHGMTVEALAGFVMRSAGDLKHTAESEAALRRHLSVLKAAVLSLTGAVA